MIITLVLLLSNSTLLASALRAPVGAVRGTSGFVTAKVHGGLADLGVTLSRSPEEVPYAL